MLHFNIESSEKLLDHVGWEILCALQHDARMSYAEIGRRVGMSAPAIMERVRRLEEAGIITGYTVRIDVAKLGLPILAVIRVRFPGDRSAYMRKLVTETPEVLECHHVTGDDCYIMKVGAESMSDLERLIGRFANVGQTTTSMILSSPVTERLLDRREAGSNGNSKP